MTRVEAASLGLAAALLSCAPHRDLLTPSGAASPRATHAPDPAPPALRLPGDVKPLRERVELTIVPSATVTSGRVDIEAAVTRPLRVVWLNATGLAISGASLGGNPARVIAASDDFVGLTTDAEIGPGPLAIELAFTGAIDHEKSRGIYAQKDGADDYVYTFFESIDARRAFPCFDEPIYKIPWNVVLHVPADDVALGNAPVVREESEPASGRMKRVELAETKPLPSYLVAFVVGPFEIVDDGVAGRAKTVVRFVVPKGRANELRWAKDVTPRVVSALEDYFDMPYPWGKLDVAVVPRYWGTMEHPGLVAMGQTLTLIRPEEETRARKEGYADILAHELSHYWFGDYVTMAWWDDTWLNEALGEWSDLNITDAVEPGWRIRDERVGMATAAMTADEALATHAIRTEVTTRDAIESSFDGEITYLKGSSVLRMFEAFTGHEQWRDFIREYVRAHAWGNASSADFTGAIRAHFGPGTAAGFESFLTQPGVPAIAITCTSGALAIHQSRSLPAGVTDPSPKLWRVPVCFRYGDAHSSARACVQLDGASGSFPVARCPAWILPNADANGYYRSTIDLRSATALLDAASPIARVAKPTIAERMMIVADLTAMTARDALPVDQLLSVVPKLLKDPDPKVASAGIETGSFATGGLDDTLYLAVRKWQLRTFGGIARDLGWKRAAGDSDEREELRQNALAAVARHDEELGRKAETLADGWIADRHGVDDEVAGIALDAAAWRGDHARFARYLSAARSARDRDEQQRILRAMGSFQDRASVDDALALVLGTEFDLRDSSVIVRRLAAQRETRDLALPWVTEHLDELLARMRDDEASWFLGALAGSFCDPQRRVAIGALVTPRAARVGGGAAAVSRALEESDRCIAESKRDAPALRRFLGGL